MTDNEIIAAAEHVLSVIGERYSLSDLSFEEGSCTLSFGGGYVITVYAQLEGLRSIILHSAVGIIPLDGKDTPSLMKEMLNANDAWSSTQGATLGMDKKTGMVSLWQRFVLPAASREEIIETIEVLLGTTEYWQDIIKQHQGENLFEGEAAAPQAGFGGVRA